VLFNEGKFNTSPQKTKQAIKGFSLDGLLSWVGEVRETGHWLKHSKDQ
jgi:hypothetical protein